MSPVLRLAAAAALAAAVLSPPVPARAAAPLGSLRPGSFAPGPLPPVSPVQQVVHPHVVIPWPVHVSWQIQNGAGGVYVLLADVQQVTPPLVYGQAWMRINGNLMDKQELDVDGHALVATSVSPGNVQACVGVSLGTGPDAWTGEDCRALFLPGPIGQGVR